MFIVTRIWISISDLDLNSIIESHNENLKNLLNFIIIIKMANGMGSFAHLNFYLINTTSTHLTPPRICGVEGDSGDSRAEARDVRPTHGHSAPPVHQG